MVLGEIGCERMGWVQVAQLRSGEHGNERLGSIKVGEFLDQQSRYQLLKEDPAP
jgi:hypothetical protein